MKYRKPDFRPPGILVHQKRPKSAELWGLWDELRPRGGVVVLTGYHAEPATVELMWTPEGPGSDPQTCFHLYPDKVLHVSEVLYLGDTLFWERAFEQREFHVILTQNLEFIEALIIGGQVYQAQKTRERAQRWRANHRSRSCLLCRRIHHEPRPVIVPFTTVSVRAFESYDGVKLGLAVYRDPWELFESGRPGDLPRIVDIR